MGSLFIVALVVVVMLAVCAFCFIPDRGKWKRWAAGILPFIMIAVYFMVGMKKHLDITKSVSFNTEACFAAERMIKDGRRAELAEKLEKAVTYERLRDLSLPETAEYFAEAVKEAEKGGRE